MAGCTCYREHGIGALLVDADCPQHGDGANRQAELPAHLRPSSCYVCGSAPHPPTSGHVYWSNADAARDFAAADRSRDTGSAEARYVDQHRPY